MTDLDIERRVYPERFTQSGIRIPERYLGRNWIPGYVVGTCSGEQRARKPLAPHERLAVRLQILVEMREQELRLMHEIIADSESLADAKHHFGKEAIDAIRTNDQPR